MSGRGGQSGLAVDRAGKSSDIILDSIIRKQIRRFYVDISYIRSTNTEKVQTCSRLRLNTSKLVFTVNMTLAVRSA